MKPLANDNDEDKNFLKSLEDMIDQCRKDECDAEELFEEFADKYYREKHFGDHFFDEDGDNMDDNSGPPSHIEYLRSLVQPYVADQNLPLLKCDGQLHGVGFILDEDEDYRVLVAIEKLLIEQIHVKSDVFGERTPILGKETTKILSEHIAKNPFTNFVAVAEHEGGLDVFSRKASYVHGELNVCLDCWQVEQFVAFNGEWVETTSDFSNDCINIVLGLQKPKRSS